MVEWSTQKAGKDGGKEQTFVCDLPCALKEESLLDVALLRSSGGRGHGLSSSSWSRAKGMKWRTQAGVQILLASLNQSGPLPDSIQPPLSIYSALFSLFLHVLHLSSAFFSQQKKEKNSSVSQLQ